MWSHGCGSSCLRMCSLAMVVLSGGVWSSKGVVVGFSLMGAVVLVAMVALSGGMWSSKGVVW